MAKYQTSFSGDLTTVVDHLHRGILEASATASYEDGSDFDLGPVQVRTRVYERYSLMGGNRVSLNVTAVGQDGVVGLSMIASGGSDAVMVKIQEFGEYGFLDTGIQALKSYLAQTGQEDAPQE